MAAQFLNFQSDRVWAQKAQSFSGARFVFGVDEVGRGCVAGPVVAACVGYRLDQVKNIQVPVRIDDSKKLSSARREQSVQWIESTPQLFSAWVQISAEEIDQTNILRAALKAMTLSFKEVQRKLQVTDDESFVILVDGNQAPPDLPKDRMHLITKGDSKSFAIAAAAIVAKQARDQMMVDLSIEYPHYHWHSNVGYLSAVHKQAVQEHGLSPWHRRSFKIL